MVPIYRGCPNMAVILLLGITIQIATAWNPALLGNARAINPSHGRSMTGSQIERIIPGDILAAKQGSAAEQTQDKTHSDAKKERDGCFGDYQNVTCRGSSINEIPQDLDVRITNLVFYRTNISDLAEGALDAYGNLRYLVFYHNPLRHISAGAFRSLTKLTTLDLVSGSESASLEERTFEGLGALESLSITRFGLKELPKYVLHNSTNLKQLNLFGNRIGRLEKGIILRTLENLEELDLSGNIIETIEPMSLAEMPNITSLILTRNNLTTFGSAFMNDLPKLTELYLDDNGLTSLGDDLCGNATSLMSIHLNMNKLAAAALADSLRQCSGVEFLDLSDNLLSSLATQTFVNMSKLTTLFLDSNSFTRVPTSALEGIDSSLTLHLSRNNISHIMKDDFTGVKNLTEFHSREMRSQLTVSKGAFNNNLRVLDVSGNSDIMMNGDAISSLVGIESIDLSNCNIKVIKEDAFSNITTLQRLDLSRNPFVCDCQALWLHDARVANKSWVQNWGTPGGPSAPTCGTPGWLPYPLFEDLSVMSSKSLTCDQPGIGLLTPANTTTTKPEIDVVMEANLTKGFPYSTWIFPDGQTFRIRTGSPPIRNVRSGGYSISETMYHDSEYVETSLTVYAHDIPGTVNYTLIASNMFGSKKVEFWVTLPQVNSAGKPILPGASTLMLLVLFAVRVFRG